MLPTQDLNVIETVRLGPPRALKDKLPMTGTSNRTVVEGRRAVQRILRHEDSRLLVVVGPCSIHDTRGALEYAGRLTRLREELADKLYIVMRVYFEKPRTTVGWKGLISDPHLDGSNDIEAGLRDGAAIAARDHADGTSRRAPSSSTRSCRSTSATS